MSAKDPRKACAVVLPPALRQVLARERARGRTGSGAAALRRLVERALAAGAEPAPRDLANDGGGRVYRLQLSSASRTRIAALARARDVNEAEIIVQLIAAVGDFPPEM